MAPRCLQPAMLTPFHGGNNNNNNNNNRRKSCRVRPKLPVAVFAALVLASSLWVGGQNCLNNSSGVLGSGKNNNNNNNDNNNNKKNNKVAAWHDSGSKTASSICFHGLQHRPAWASKARPRLVGRGSPHVLSSTRQPPSVSVQRFAEDPKRKLTRELSSATSAQAVLSVLEQQGINNLNEFHISAAFSRLARNKRDFTPAVRESPVLRKFTARLQQMLDTGNYLNARQCASVFWSIASLQTAAPELKELLHMLIENAKVTAPYMNALDVTNIIVACTKMRLSSNELTGLLKPILERLADRADFLKPQEVANCIWSAAKLKADAPEILEVMPVLMEMAYEKTLDFEAQHLSNIIWSMATLREEMPELQELLPALLRALPKRMDNLEEQAVGNVVWSLGVLQAGDLAGNGVLCSLANKGTSMIKRFKPQALANAAWGFALCGYQDIHFMSAIASHAVASIPTWPQKYLSMALPLVICVFAKFDISNSSLLLASTAKHLPPILRNAVDWTICALAWSYNKLDPQREFADFQDRLAKELKRRKLSPQDVERSQLGPHEWQKRPERRQ